MALREKRSLGEPPRQAERLAGALLALFGGVSLLNALAGDQLHGTWWANLLFLPAIALLAAGTVIARPTPKKRLPVAGMLLGAGALLFALAAILLFGALRS
jgi:drug/metabolite transporter (DMT)-like permease